MQIAGIPDSHLFYCLNAYPCNTLPELDRAVFTEAAGVWQSSGLPGPHAVGLWLNAGILPEFHPQNFLHRLQEAGLYCCSLNGFPYGVFHGGRVKERVYTPDWSTPERLAYTKSLARALTLLLPVGRLGTISTLPVAYRAAATPELVEQAKKNLREMGAYLAQLHQQTGRNILLAIEPEPDCFLDASRPAARWLEEELFAGAQERDLRQHIGVCLDTVHALVQFESPAQALKEFTSRGIRVPKLQIGAALGSRQNERDPLLAFDDGTYLHQTRVECDGRQLAYADLPQALLEGPGGEWRVHFHIPLTWPGGGGLECVAAGLDRDFFRLAVAEGVRHFEVEIYTLSVFPNRTESDREIFARELRTVHDLL